MVGEKELPRVTPEHTTAETIQIMNDRNGSEVLVVDRDSKRVVGRLSRATLISQCVRGWHEPDRCRVGTHLGAQRLEGSEARRLGSGAVV